MYRPCQIFGCVDRASRRTFVRRMGDERDLMEFMDLVEPMDLTQPMDPGDPTGRGGRLARRALPHA
ncbi:hypothetical protein GPN2_10188 [Streptomyces murinus]